MAKWPSVQVAEEGSGQVVEWPSVQVAEEGSGQVVEWSSGQVKEEDATSRGANLDTNSKFDTRHSKSSEHSATRPLGHLTTSVRLTPLQQRILAQAETCLEDDGGLPTLRTLADAAGAKTIGPVKKLIDLGLLETVHTTGLRADPLELAALTARDLPIADQGLTKAQKRAIDQLADTIQPGGFSVTLLHGVTGSGKTEVYLRSIEQVIQKHPDEPVGVVVLVPEIALTPQTITRFAGRLRHIPGGESRGLAVLHSGLTAAQRHEQWKRIQQGKAQIVVGARSAIFAPLPALHLIIVDEEHENSYKQDQLPRYHARDLAVKRGQLCGATVLLGSATPSLESYWNAGRSGQVVEWPSGQVKEEGSGRVVEWSSGRVKKEESGQVAQWPSGQVADSATEKVSSNPKSDIRNSKSSEHSATGPLGHWATSSKFRYRLIELPERVAGLKLPTVEIVDLREERRKRYQMQGKGGIHLLSLRLENALRQTIKAGHQAMLLLNRRGYANYIACPDHGCGWIKQCDYCDAAMVLHKDQRLPAGERLRCHHCQAEQLLPELCPVCGKKVTVFGLGTQRVEEELSRKFPELTFQRMDGDTMRNSSDYLAALERFGSGQAQVLLGTQMIAKGLDFPNVKLVGVISADTALHLPDFRAAERTFQLIAQVAGRAGRAADGEATSRVIVQTFTPEDEAIQQAAKHDYQGFARRELLIRQRDGLPPVGRMARIVCRDLDHLQAKARASELRLHLDAANESLGKVVRVRGPMTCPISRIANYHRWQLLLQGPDALSLQKLLGALRHAKLLKSDTHTAVDVDPVSLL